jgi:predicted HTH transcriptional regulator
MFQKSLNDVTPEDVYRVITEAVPESQEVEFKGELPANQGSDPWTNGREHIGDKARNELLEEVIAFANAFGGTLILGVTETKGKPARAADINPIPRCHDLAERLRLQIRDCIDPQIPIVESL